MITQHACRKWERDEPKHTQYNLSAPAAAAASVGAVLFLLYRLYSVSSFPARFRLSSTRIPSQSKRQQSITLNWRQRQRQRFNDILKSQIAFFFLLRQNFKSGLIQFVWILDR